MTKNFLPRLENGLYYTDSDIAGMYRDAKDKSAQIKILAELNACTESKIKASLIRVGIDLKRSLITKNPK